MLEVNVVTNVGTQLFTFRFHEAQCSTVAALTQGFEEIAKVLTSCRSDVRRTYVNETARSVKFRHNFEVIETQGWG